MELPHVVIVGRPNVGKSSLFNCLVGERVAITDAVAGVTRDRISRHVKHRQRVIDLVDTGGVGVVDSDDLSADVETQIAIAMGEANLILFVLDTRTGVEPLDNEVARRLRALGKPVVLVANKVESDGQRRDAANLASVGFGEPSVISSIDGFGREDLLDRIIDTLGDSAPAAEEVEAHIIKVALVGKRNAGKSTLLNQLAGSNRMTVSDIPGTTRDSVDVDVRIGDKRLILIDTAGVRKKKSIQNTLDFYSTHRTEESIRRADVVMLMIDATEELSRVDKKLADYIASQYKPVVIVLNKWDLVKGVELADYQDYLRRYLSGIEFAPVAAISALEGTHVRGAFEVAMQLYKQALQRVGTGELNRVVHEAVAQRSPAAGKTRALKIRYVTQVGVTPPYVVLFVNDHTLVQAGYVRYLAGRLRRACPFSEVPIRIDFRSTGRKRPRKKATKDAE